MTRPKFAKVPEHITCSNLQLAIEDSLQEILELESHMWNLSDIEQALCSSTPSDRPVSDEIDVKFWEMDLDQSIQIQAAARKQIQKFDRALARVLKLRGDLAEQSGITMFSHLRPKVKRETYTM